MYWLLCLLGALFVDLYCQSSPGAQLRLTVDLPLIVSRYRTSDIPFAAKPRNIVCYLDKYFDNFWQWFGKIKYTWHNTYQRNPDRITTEALVPIVCCVPDIYICALPAAILSSSLVSLPFSTKNVFHFVHFLPQVCSSTKMPFILFPFFRKFVPPLGK